jgi:hypothetical protein
MLALKALESAQKSAMYILSIMLLKRMKDHAHRQEVFIGTVTQSEIRLESPFERA